MTIEEVKITVASMNIDTMTDVFAKNGFRQANLEDVWEYDTSKLLKAKRIEETEHYEDVFDDKTYHGTIYQEVEEYVGATFISVWVSKIRILDGQRVPIPYRHYVYVDVPVDEAFMKEQNSIIRCDKCKRKIKKGNLLKYHDKNICGKCYVAEMKKIVRADEQAEKRAARELLKEVMKLDGQEDIFDD